MIRALQSALFAGGFIVAGLTLQGCKPQDARATTTASTPVALARGVVDVQGGLASVRPQRAGQLLELTTSLGQTVRRGAVLAKMQGDIQAAEADAARADLERARGELFGTQLKVRTLRSTLGRVREAVALGAESAHVADDLQAQLEALVSALPASEAAVTAAEARMRAARLISDSTVVRAPIDGRIVQVNVRTGDLVSSTEGPPMILLLPDSGLIVRASLASRDISHVHVGSVVSVSEVDGGNATYPGRAIALGELARKPDPTVAGDDFTSERVVDCTIGLDAGAKIRVGSLVLVRFD